MLVSFYKDDNLKYATRKRFKTFPNVNPFNIVELKSITLNDGAETSIKTSVDNLCDYVKIDNTRWFVTGYEYLNGSQVVLKLQRDVVGEFGIDSCFGKIERGYTNSFLKNRKELGLNQILKKRIELKINENQYGNYTVDNHENEMWGVLYFVKPDKEQDTVNINIPAFTPKIVNYNFIEEDRYLKSNEVSYYKHIYISVRFRDNNFQEYRIVNNNGNTNVTLFNSNEQIYNSSITIELNTPPSVANKQKIVDYISKAISNYIFNDKVASEPVYPNLKKDNDYIKYNGVTIKKDNDYLVYSCVENSYKDYGSSNIFNILYYIIEYFNKNPVNYGIRNINIGDYSGKDAEIYYYYDGVYVSYRQLESYERGEVVVDLNKQLVDEPFIVLACPLYSTNINGLGKSYKIDREQAFNCFNTCVSYLSGGSNPYIIDAQILPYCPDLVEVTTSVKTNDNKEYPFFSVIKSSYERNIPVQLLPSKDIKKEYITREYKIISPDKSGEYTFNFYDYTNEIVEQDEIEKNYKKLIVQIKVSLKPFSIISSCNILPDTDCLYGITYESDLRGCCPSCSGFEYTLSSNAFQQYQRENSNYQNIFNKQQEYLKKQHQVELVNDITSAIINTASASAMGGIAGAAAADVSILGTKVGSTAGAAAGAISAGAIVGGAMSNQTYFNHKMRQYEYNLQEEMFTMEIGTIKNLPNQINRISSFNEIISREFSYFIEVYECSDFEKKLVDDYINKFSYSLGVVDYYRKYLKNGWFVKGNLLSSTFVPILHNVATNELLGGIYLYE